MRICQLNITSTSIALALVSSPRKFSEGRIIFPPQRPNNLRSDRPTNPNLILLASLTDWAPHLLLCIIKQQEDDRPTISLQLIGRVKNLKGTENNQHYPRITGYKKSNVLYCLSSLLFQTDKSFTWAYD